MTSDDSEFEVFTASDGEAAIRVGHPAPSSRNGGGSPMPSERIDPLFSSRLKGRDFILGRLTDAMEYRPHRSDWIEFERMAAAIATNQYAEATGLPHRVTIDEVEQIETLAVGHEDYASKLALYLSEYVHGDRVQR